MLDIEKVSETSHNIRKRKKKKRWMNISIIQLGASSWECIQYTITLVCRISALCQGEIPWLSFIPFSVISMTPSSFQNPCSPSPVCWPITHLHSLSTTSLVCAQWPTMTTPSLVHMKYLHHLLLGEVTRMLQVLRKKLSHWISYFQPAKCCWGV